MKHLLYKILLFVISVFTLSLPACCQDIRFVQITDLHYRNDSTSQERLDAIIKDINEIKNLDFVVFTGDNIDKAEPETLVKLLKHAQKINVPYYFVLGNHDLFKSAGLTREVYARLIKKYDKFQRTKNTNFEFETKGVIFIVLDGANEFIPGPGGYYKPNTLEWLDKTLTKYKKKKVVMLQHFPLKQRHTERDAYKIERYQELLKKHNNVIATFSGHFHANEEYVQDGIFHAITGRAFGSDAGYKIVDMVEEKNPDSKKKEYKFYTQMITFE